MNSALLAADMLLLATHPLACLRQWVCYMSACHHLDVHLLVSGGPRRHHAAHELSSNAFLCLHCRKTVMFSDSNAGSSHASLWQGEPPPGLDLPQTGRPNTIEAVTTPNGSADRGTRASRKRRPAGAGIASTVEASALRSPEQHRPAVPGRAGEGYRQVHFEYAAPDEQDHLAERRLQSDAFRLGLLGQSVPSASDQPPQRRAGNPSSNAPMMGAAGARVEKTSGSGRSEGDATTVQLPTPVPTAGGEEIDGVRTVFRFQAGTAAAAAAVPPQDSTETRRSKKKGRHRERKRARKEDRERRRGRDDKDDPSPVRGQGGEVSASQSTTQMSVIRKGSAVSFTRVRITVSP